MRSTALNLNKGRSRVVLSLTPLIDVVFILLVFFMLVSQFTNWRQVEMTPQASLGNQSGDLLPLLITVGTNDTITVNGELVEGASDAAAKTVAAMSGGQTVIIQPLQGATIQPVVSLFEALAEADVKNVRVDGRGTGQ